MPKTLGKRFYMQAAVKIKTADCQAKYFGYSDAMKRAKNQMKDVS